MSLSKVVLVTGANTGIGYEAVKALMESAKNYRVFLGSRSLDKANSAIESLKKACPQSSSTVEPLVVDLASDASIEKAFAQVEADPGHIDALVNNAGATFDIEFLHGKVSLRDSFMSAYNVNVAGTQVMTWTFMPLLLKSADPRLIFVSGLSGINQAMEKYYPTPELPAGWPKNIEFETIGYRSSKCAINMCMVDWAHKLRNDKVKVWGVLPGMLATNLGGLGPEKAREMGAGDPSLGGQFLRSVVEGERDADVGKLIRRDGVSQP